LRRLSSSSGKAESILNRRLRAFSACFVLTLCACGRSSTIVPPPGRGTTPIRHVVFIVQENRSFNNLFMGFPNATTANYGYDTNGDKIALGSEPLATGWDIDHSSYAFLSACDGTGKIPGTHCKMDGWNHERVGFMGPTNAPYSYVPRSEIEPYWQMARQYVLADRTFSSNIDASFVAHQYIVAAYSSRSVDFPATYWGCEGGKFDTLATLNLDRSYGPHIPACYDNPTIASEADSAGIGWRFYADRLDNDDGIWSSYQADRAIFRGPDWKHDVINPPARFLQDVAAGTLASITWITPTDVTSDHPGLGASLGPAWVASVVDAIGASRFWNSTAIFVFWDDWGGMFDPVKPVYEDYDGLGFRVPLIVVSPYAKRGYVTHVQYETASILRYMEDNFGLSPLAAADTRANDPAMDAFDYAQSPRPFQRIAGAKPTSYWLHLEGPSGAKHRSTARMGSD
jgi:phospholipase C